MRKWNTQTQAIRLAQNGRLNWARYQEYCKVICKHLIHTTLPNVRTVNGYTICSTISHVWRGKHCPHITSGCHFFFYSFLVFVKKKKKKKVYLLTLCATYAVTVKHYQKMASIQNDCSLENHSYNVPYNLPHINYSTKHYSQQATVNTELTML